MSNIGTSIPKKPGLPLFLIRNTATQKVWNDLQERWVEDPEDASLYVYPADAHSECLRMQNFLKAPSLSVEPYSVKS